MIHAALRQSKMFSGWMTGVLSFCVTCLSLIAMGLMFVSPQTDSGRSASPASPGMPIILTPYAALGICLLILFVLMSLAKLFGGGKADKHEEDFLPPKVYIPSKKKSKPSMPIDLPSDFKKRSRQKNHTETDLIERALRDLNSIDRMNAVSKPMNRKGVRYEK
jgi:hypothetical protein